MIEQELRSESISLIDYSPLLSEFQRFKAQNWFPSHYHGGIKSGVCDEKLLEHFIALKLLDLNQWVSTDIYVDIAACTSPWASLLRQRLNVKAFAIDMSPVHPEFVDLSYYRSDDATQTSFDDNEISGASLQCAFEMFHGDGDTLLIKK